MGQIQRNIAQLGGPTSKDRIVTTLLMTDIVDSTAIASRLGHTTRKQLLGEHNRLTRSRFGLPVRLGVHTGEVELLPGDIGGIAVHATARVMALGGASDIMVSSSTRGLVEGGDLRFESRGEQQLKGLAGPLGVFALVD
jgi:class 3 adenylate cyclase